MLSKKQPLKGGAYPFVHFKMQPTNLIGSTSTLIYGSQTTCLLDGLTLANQTSNTILVSCYLLREIVGDTPDPVTEDFYLFKNMPILALQSMDWMQGKSMTLEAEDTLFAYSDYNDNLFNTFVSYRELTELAPVTQ